MLETRHLEYHKIVLNRKNSTPDLMVYGETGRFKLEYYVKKRMINYWSTIACGNRNKLAYTMFNICKQKYARGPRSECIENLVSMVNTYLCNLCVARTPGTISTA